MTRSFILAAALATVAVPAAASCRSHHKAAPDGATANVPPPAAAAPARDDLASLERDACACRDAACANVVKEKFKAWAKMWADVLGDDEAIRAERTAESLSRCVMSALSSAGGGTGLPDCDVIVWMTESSMECDKVPEAARRGTQQALDAAKAGWADYSSAPDDVKEQTNNACKQALDNLRGDGSTDYSSYSWLHGCPIHQAFPRHVPYRR
jgi:hypothetical protein